MSRQGSNHEIIDPEDEEDLDLSPVSSAYDEEEDDWFEEHDEWDDEPEEYDEPDYDDGYIEYDDEPFYFMDDNY